MIEIRELRSIDPAAIRRVVTGYVSPGRFAARKEETPERVAITLAYEPLDAPYVKRFDVTEEYLAMYREAVREGRSFGAWDGDALVGVAITERREWERVLWVLELGVAESHRGRGIGRTLVERLVACAAEGGLRAVVCETQNTNVPAIGFYRAVGFVCDGIDLSYYTNTDTDDFEVAIFMKRKLG